MRRRAQVYAQERRDSTAQPDPEGSSDFLLRERRVYSKQERAREGEPWEGGESIGLQVRL